MQSQMLEKTRSKIEEWRTRTRAKIEQWKTRRTGSTFSPQGLIREIREKGLVEAVRARRRGMKGYSGYRPSKEYRKEAAVEASAQLKVQRPRISIEA